MAQMPRLKEYHFDLLRRIISAGKLPVEEIDGRVIRPLRAAGLVRVDDNRVTATEAGKQAIPDQRGNPEAIQPAGKLSAAQEDLLRLIIRQGNASLDGVDLRTARALRSRGLVRESAGALSATPEGVARLDLLRPASEARRRGRPPRRHARAEAILSAVEKIERALPRGAEVLVGNIMCAAEDVTSAFRGLARKLTAESDKRGKP